MYPVIHLGFMHVPTYALMIAIGAIGFVITTIVLLEKVEHVPRKVCNRLLIIAAAGFAVLGASAFVFNSIFHSIQQGKIVIGGITWLGGVLGAFPVTVLLIHKFCPQVKGEALKYFNLFLPGLVLAHGFGRIGCFFGGCCHGGVTDSIFGVIFPEGSSAAILYPGKDGNSLPVLPTQLFEAAFEFVLYALMLVFHKRIKEYHLVGWSFAYGVFRFVLEFWRGDLRGSTGFFLSPSQLMSIVLILGAVLVLLYQKGLIFRKLKERMRLYVEQREVDAPPPDEKDQTIRTIRELKALYDEGIITAEEFEKKKTELLDSI